MDKTRIFFNAALVLLLLAVFIVLAVNTRRLRNLEQILLGLHLEGVVNQ